MFLSSKLLSVFLNKSRNFPTGNKLRIMCLNMYKFVNSRTLCAVPVTLILSTNVAEIRKKSWPFSLKFSYMWLRDHCRCDECYNFHTNQRKLDLLNVASNIHPKHCIVDGEVVRISWSDGHSSLYDVNWLWNNNYQSYIYHINNAPRPTLWNRLEAEKMHVGRVPSETFMNSQTGLKEVVKSILKYGVAFVTNVLATVDATNVVALRLCSIQHTLFGDMWEFSDKMVHNDTAYSKQSLGTHTDGTYLTESPGIQVFHCLHHDGSGGQTLLVDGFRAATEVKNLHPQVYHRLNNTTMEAEYLEEGKHYAAVGTALRCHPVSGLLEQVRFNLYDRAPLRTVPVEHVDRAYSDLQCLAKQVREPSGEWCFKLVPGTVVFIDNWRVLHGRASYTGRRRMAGCYLGRADFLSTARHLGLV